MEWTMSFMNANSVYNLVKRIPKGYVLTYGDIAKFCSLSSPRIVGRLLHNNPDEEHIPCHRVVHADGSLAPNYAFGGGDVQRKRLLDEGVIFSGKKVYLRASRWNLEKTQK